MDTLEKWLEDWKNITDPRERENYLKNVPQELANAPEVEKLKAWWNARYYYADKNHTRLGDRYVWLYLAMSKADRSKAGTAEFKKVYEDALMSGEAKAAYAIDRDMLAAQLFEAAVIYISTIGDPPPILGLIPQRDKTPEARTRRIARMIIEDHLVVVYKMVGKLDYADTVAEQLFKAGEETHSGIEKDLLEIIDDQKSDDYKIWLKGILFKNGIV